MGLGLDGERLHPVACEHWLDGCRDKLLCHRLSWRSFCEGPINLDEETCRTCWGRHLLWRGLRGRGKTHTASLVPSHIPLELRWPLKFREDADFGTTENLEVSLSDRESSSHYKSKGRWCEGPPKSKRWRHLRHLGRHKAVASTGATEATVSFLITDCKPDAALET